MKKLDIYLANLVVGNIKLHNLHWNVKGFAFKQVHEYLESLYDEVFEKMDEVAELQKMKGEFPKASVKQSLELASVKELEDKSWDVKEAVTIALEYVKEMKKLALEIRSEVDEKDNFALANMMEDHIAGYSKEIWFMESMLA
ncbi:DNA-binding ferritin-like protein (oxidative damage protectant) [Jonquetella anthropi DSM 22815]|uniref:DNA-binding ferritin-like protein (Oxidative damage protectant) n=1 Tax=Jonquetella anthropi DSM 22815 TaxID=885272 RepID=H0UJX8_9BACT|nr:DNA starvation/stationary phase protection protein [Jonquetella anthropi]EHM12988.1 DNA-binding ferritin-like protein (oxidative damage protectant) [Jonquetella anthropi DSM 22815]